MSFTTPCMLESSQAAHLNFANTSYSILITLYWAHYNTISKALKSNPLGKHLIRSRQDAKAYLPMSFTLPSRLENSQAAHPNIVYTPVYSNVYPLLAIGTHYIAISKLLKPNQMGGHLQGSK